VVISTGRVGRLRRRLLHYSYWNYHDYFRRLQRYSTYQAQKWHEQGRQVSLLKLFFNLPFRFLQLFFVRLGFLDGLVGLQVCALTALYSFSKQACLWQLHCGRTREQANGEAADVIVAGPALADSPAADRAGMFKRGFGASAGSPQLDDDDRLRRPPQRGSGTAVLLRSLERVCADSQDPDRAVFTGRARVDQTPAVETKELENDCVRRADPDPKKAVP
jgi:hypothetical protein